MVTKKRTVEEEEVKIKKNEYGQLHAINLLLDCVTM